MTPEDKKWIDALRANSSASTVVIYYKDGELDRRRIIEHWLKWKTSGK